MKSWYDPGKMLHQKVKILTRRIATIDIETSDLRNADINYVTVVSIKPFGKSPIVLSITPEEARLLNPDERIIRQLHDLLEMVDVIVTHYGKGFDSKFLRTRFAKFGLSCPRRIIIHDTYNVLQKMQMRRSLENGGNLFGISIKKMKVSFGTFGFASRGDPDSLEILRKRCSSDVRLTERLYKKMLENGYDYFPETKF